MFKLRLVRIRAVENHPDRLGARKDNLTKIRIGSDRKIHLCGAEVSTLRYITTHYMSASQVGTLILLPIDLAVFVVCGPLIVARI